MGEENKDLRLLYRRKDLESHRKVLILPELAMAHPLGGTPLSQVQLSPQTPGRKARARAFLLGVDAVLRVSATWCRNPDISEFCAWQ